VGEGWDGGFWYNKGKGWVKGLRDKMGKALSASLQSRDRGHFMPEGVAKALLMLKRCHVANDI